MTTDVGLGLPPLIGGGPAQPAGPGDFTAGMRTGIERLKRGPPNLLPETPQHTSPAAHLDVYGPGYTPKVDTPVPPELTPQAKPAAQPPVSTQPKSSRVATPQGPYGPPQPGDAFSRDFGPGAGQVWGPSGGVMASGRGGITPNYLGGPTPQGVTPQAIAAAQNAFMLPTAARPGGTTPAGLPALAQGAGAPGAAPGGGGLGAALSGLGGGLLNMLSMTPPQGVPGMNTPAQYLQGGMNAPLPAPPWLRQQGQGAPGAPGFMPTAQGPVAQPVAQPAAAPGAPGQPAAQPTGALADIDAQIANAQYQAQRARQGAIATSTFNPALSKSLQDAADKFEERANGLIQKKAEAALKTGGDQGAGGGEIGAQARANAATKEYEAISTDAGKIRTPSGPLGLLRSVTEMRQALANTDLKGAGAAQPLLDRLAGVVAMLDPATSEHMANAQEFDAWKGQELAQLASTLYGQGGQRILKQEFESLRQHNYDRSFRPEAINAMLDAAEARAKMAVGAYNTRIDNFPKIHKGFYSADDLAPLKIRDDEIKSASAPIAQAPTVAPEGQTMTNPQTGQKIIKRNGQWQPLQ